MDEGEHGATMWGPRFRDLSVSDQVRWATVLTRQSAFLKKRPFAHSGADVRKLAERMVAKDDGESEFMWSLSFDHAFVARLAREGFLPMAGRIFSDLICLLPKLHVKRCMMLDLQADLRVGKNARKRSKRYYVSIDQDFNKVITGCQKQHGGHCWFYATLTHAYRKIHGSNSVGGVADGVRMHSIELWDKETGKLVAGEIGYAIGGVYTSLSGFRAPSTKSAGTIQCCCVALLLRKSGFVLWDLGMGMDYKYKLGAQDVPRNEFLQLLRSVRDMQVILGSFAVEAQDNQGASKNDPANTQNGENLARRIDCRQLLCGLV